MNDARFLPRQDLSELLSLLQGDGYRLVGPTEEQGAIVYREIDSTDALPAGLVDHQAPGSYRLERQAHHRWFDWVGTAQGLKPLLFTPEQPLWVAHPDDNGFNFKTVADTPPPTAVIGVRSCDLAALALQDRHFLHGAFVDPHYQARRQSLLLIAVNCHRSADTCFCVSTGDGPEVKTGADLVLDELDEGFEIRATSDTGQALLGRLATQALHPGQQHRNRELRQQATVQQRALPSTNLRDPLYAARADERHWQPVAARCLTCGNCTAVCPTCFCFRVDQQAPLDGSESEAVRRWDSCFSDEHSYVVGHVVRKSAEHKYRQWLTHKLAIWHDQYGRSGCTGCGRCITWCPVGIDLVEEAQRLCREVKDDD